MKNLLLLGGDINMDLGTIGTKIDDIDVEISYKIIQLFSAGLYSSPNKGSFCRQITWHIY